MNATNTNKRGLLIAVGVVAAVVIFAAFVSLRRTEVPVRVATATRSTFRSSISTNGKIEPLENFEAHAPMATTVQRVYVHEGDHVKAGQLLLQLDDADARAQSARALAQMRAAAADVHALKAGGSQEDILVNQAQMVKAKSDRDTAARNLESLRRLLKEGAASPGEVRDAEDQMKRAEAELYLVEQKQTNRYSPQEAQKVTAQETQAKAAYDAAQDVLKDSNVRSTQEGVVYSLPVRAGEYVKAGDLLVQVADLSSVQVRAFVDETDLGHLAPGEKVTVTWDALPGRTWQGAVTRVPSVVKMRGTRNVGEVTCKVDNADVKLLPNVDVSVTITTAEHDNVLTVPREAVHEENGTRFVYVINNGELHRKPVQLVFSNLTQAEITGLSDNAQVALSSTAAQPLRDGLPVRVEQ